MEKKMKVLIPGGSGFLGRALTQSLLADNHEVWVLTRSQPKNQSAPHLNYLQWDGRTTNGWLDAFAEMDAVVNLAGDNVGDQLWTDAKKKRMRQSRVDASLAVVTAFQRASRRPAVLLQASGVGYYGPRGAEPVHENTPPGTDFFSSLAQDWEAATRIVDSLGVRRVILRTSLVLEKSAGILPRMALPVQFFAGGPLGSGKQGVSWIHLQDHVRAMRFLLENPKAIGAFNLSAPNPLSNADFMRSLAQTLSRPYWLPAPAFALRLALGEMSTLLLDGQFAIPQRLVNLGFVFQYETVEQAFSALYASR